MDAATFDLHAPLSRPLTTADVRNLKRLATRPELNTVSISAGRPEHRETPLGVFEFRHVKPELLRGYCMVELQGTQPGQQALVATPEKALLDLVYLQPGGDAPSYLHELRLQNMEKLDMDRLHRQAKVFPCICGCLARTPNRPRQSSTGWRGELLGDREEHRDHCAAHQHGRPGTGGHLGHAALGGSGVAENLNKMTQTDTKQGTILLTNRYSHPA